MFKKETIKAYNQEYGIADFIEFNEGAGGFTFVHIKNNHAEAQISLYGGQVTHYQPFGEEPVVWISPLAEFKYGKAIRGGIPICWPWFGPHLYDTKQPQHGVARVSNWSVVNTCILQDQQVKVVLRCDQDVIDQLTEWKGVTLELTIILGRALTLELCTYNHTSVKKSLGGALHSYLFVQDINQAILRGLKTTQYLDKLDNYTTKLQTDDVTLEKETDREYINTKADCFLWDKALNRHVKISKGGSGTTVVWNPWKTTSKQMTDFPDAGYLTMVCVEAAITAQDEYILLPNESHVLSQTISLI